MSKRKYCKGEQIKSIHEFLNRATSPCMYGDQPLFYFAVGARPLTYSFLSGMPLRVIENAINHGRLWVAEKKKEESHDTENST